MTWFLFVCLFEAHLAGRFLQIGSSDKQEALEAWFPETTTIQAVMLLTFSCKHSDEGVAGLLRQRNQSEEQSLELVPGQAR